MNEKIILIISIIAILLSLISITYTWTVQNEVNASRGSVLTTMGYVKINNQMLHDVKNCFHLHSDNDSQLEVCISNAINYELG